MIRCLGLSIFLFFMIGTESFCQEKRQKDFLRFWKKKEAKKQVLDTVDVVEENWFSIDDSYLDSLAAQERLASLEEAEAKEEVDSNQFVLSYGIPLAVSDQLMIDSIWVSLKDYYKTWSGNKVNPYDLDGEKFRDTVHLPLTFEKPQLDWCMPLEQMTVTSPFGLRRWKWHYGDDIRLSVGDSVRVAFDGIVRLARYDRYGYGHYVLVRHYNGLETLYGHLSKRSVQPGQVLKAGEIVGLGGSTGRSSGPHLHFEVRYEGNAIKPSDVFDFENMQLRTHELEVNPVTFSYLKEARKIRYHRVRSGDTLGHIGRRYGVTISKICRLNGISRNSILRIGQRLRIT